MYSISEVKYDIIESEVKVIALIYWQIKIGEEQNFEEWWGDKTKTFNGLIFERLSKPENPISNFTTWNEIIDKPDSTIYINVGLWESSDHFKNAFKDITDKIFPFEKYMRRRVLLNPKLSRLLKSEVLS